MRFMVMDYFAQSPMLWFPLLALGLFMLVFVLVTLRAFATSKSRYDAVASLPLCGESTEPEVERA